MSILLEALRKSEKNQNSPEAPDIHSDNFSNRQSDAIQIGPLAVLLVLALFTSGWFVWNQYKPATDRGQASETAKAVASSAAVSDQEEQADQVVQKIQKPASKQLPEAQLPGDRLSGGLPRTPVESFQPMAKNTPVIKAAPDGGKAPAKSNREASAFAGAGADKEQTTPPVDQSSRPDNEPEQKYRPQEPAPISYWELPDSIRENVPEIKFSVLVYAKQAENRFVLINGQRLREGDSVQTGLVIREIRRDGVVFSYRLYRFLVER